MRLTRWASANFTDSVNVRMASLSFGGASASGGGIAIYGAKQEDYPMLVTFVNLTTCETTKYLIDWEHVTVPTEIDLQNLIPLGMISSQPVDAGFEKPVSEKDIIPIIDDSEIVVCGANATFQLPTPQKQSDDSKIIVCGANTAIQIATFD